MIKRKMLFFVDHLHYVGRVWMWIKDLFEVFELMECNIMNWIKFGSNLTVA